MPAPKSVKSCRICFLPVASPHFGKNTCASSANRSMMLPPLDVTPLLSNALRYSSATDFRCSSVIVILLTAIGYPSSSLARFSQSRMNLNTFSLGGIGANVSSQRTGLSPMFANECTQPTPVHRTSPGFAR